jgi:hypothetical protein
MKYIKLFEIYDTSYLMNYKKYILFVYSGRIYVFENMVNQLKKLYSSEYGEFKLYDKPFYFSPDINNFIEMFAYDSDNLDDVLKNVDLMVATKKYNL